MILLNINNKTYELPLIKGVLLGICTLDEHWRTMDYKHTDSSLGLSVQLTYDVPMEHTNALFHTGVVPLNEDDLEEGQGNILVLEFDINHSTYDPKSGKIQMHDGFPRFPEPSFLEGFRFSPETLAASHVWFPGFGVSATFSKIGFGALSSSASIALFCEGKVKDAVSELMFTITEEQLTLQYDFQIEGYPNEFIGFSDKALIKEITDCFASLYDAAKYNSSIQITDSTHGGVRISYRLKE